MILQKLLSDEDKRHSGMRPVSGKHIEITDDALHVISPERHFDLKESLAGYFVHVLLQKWA